MKTELMQSGLSDKEAEVYLACLKAGPVTANRIADLVGYARSTTYDLLENLKHQGFVTSFVRDKKAHFAAADPDILLAQLEERKKEAIESYEKKEQLFRKLAVGLRRIKQQIGAKPVAEVYEGVASITKILDDIAEQAEELRIIGSQEHAVEQIGYRTDRFRAKRKERGFKVRQILEDSQAARNERQDELTEVRFLKTIGASKEACFIYGNTTVHLLLGGEIAAIKVRSVEYARMQAIVFDELWKNASR